ncbi:hypothetical protein B296_00055035 [Ensete ventricosum]|uniref:Uncharacterized protein n=1 Tax=Ensete ventricosum TaxID=4639 RepID=A0A426Y1X0_ENSVE|nr:hypothetical protein B296_00055035 [Ensete ventricosum]
MCLGEWCLGEGKEPRKGADAGESSRSGTDRGWPFRFRSCRRGTHVSLTSCHKRRGDRFLFVDGDVAVGSRV